MGIKHTTRIAGTDISKSAIYGENHEIEGGTIVTADIADGAITSAKIAQGTIISADVAAGITEIPTNYLIYKSGSTYYARNGSTGVLDFSGSLASTVIQSALGALTAGRTWKESVTLKGDIQILVEITVPSYTKLNIEGTLKAAGTIAGSMLLLNGVSNIDIFGGTVDGATSATTGILLKDVTDINIETLVRSTTTNCIYVQDNAQRVNIDAVVDGVNSDYGIRLYVVNNAAGYIRDISIKAQITQTDAFGFWVGNAAGKPTPDNVHCDVIVDGALLRGVGLAGKINGRISCFNCPNQDGIEIYDGVFNLQLNADYNGVTAVAENIIMGPDTGTHHIEGIFNIISTRSGRRGVSIQNTSTTSKILLLGTVTGSVQEGVFLDGAYGVIVKVTSSGNTYGVRESSFVQQPGYNSIEGCDLRGNSTAACLLVSSTSVARNNMGYNPIGKVTNCFDSTADEIELNGATAVPEANTYYTIKNTDIFINSSNSGGADCAIIIYDKNDNQIYPQTGSASTLNGVYVPLGCKINWGNFTGAAPTVVVSFV